MVLIAPVYRPLVKPPRQIQPHNVTLNEAGEILIEPVDMDVQTTTPASGRQTVLEGEFDTDYETALPWINVNNAFNSDTMSVAFTTMNGFKAIAVTWEAGALPSHRWGGRMDLPGADIGDHAWLTWDMMFSDPFSAGDTNFGGKLPGLRGVTSVPICTGDLACDDGWQGQLMWNGQKSVYSGSDVLPGHHFIYHIDKTQNCGDRDDFDNWPNKGWTLGEPNTIEVEFKINSAFDASDGIVRTRINGNLVKERTNFRFYCGSESNRAGTLISIVLFQMFWGGANSTWSPTVDSTMTFGHFKVEIPA